MRIKVSPSVRFTIDISKIAPDKSISHRSVIFSLLSNKPSFVKNYLQGEDTLHTLEIAKKLGLVVKAEKDGLVFIPPDSLKEPSEILDCGNAGTAIRLYLGLLSVREGMFILSGDCYLNARPMKRIVEPLRQIGATIFGRDEGNLAPLVVMGKSRLSAFDYVSKIASAQVKSALILSGLYSDGECKYTESQLSRDHTERMLIGMGARLESKFHTNGALELKIFPQEKPLNPLEIDIPADPSSAFFFALAIAITPDSRGILRNVLLNPTRIEAFKVLEKMGVHITYKEYSSTYESIGDIEIISPHCLKAVEVYERITWLIDEIPALAIAMACAKGVSRVSNAKELRVKETDRITAVVKNLKICGIEAKELEDGFEICGGDFKMCEVPSYGDHRIAMSFAIAGLRSGIVIAQAEYINISFPNFLEILNVITQVEVDNES
ncbi:MAG: 3-phosphoshikimate 1-carboxyvinyltransferase [Helicobacter sp.]|nr:3-phosphoshikimate 1-carboxyvinyltransferase [Helicobacter sp.]